MFAAPRVSVDEVAKHLSMAKVWIYRWTEHKGLPTHNVGHLWRFKLSEVDQWVRDGGASPNDHARNRERAE